MNKTKEKMKFLFDRRYLLWIMFLLLGVVVFSLGALYFKRISPPSPLEGPVTIEPWVQADDSISPSPAIPSSPELYQLFLEARKAIEENNQEAMREKLSQQLLWQSENPVGYLGENEDGLVVYVRRDISQASYFQEFLIFSPTPDQVTPLEVVFSDGKTTAASQVVLVKNEATGKTERLVITPWRYLARLKVQRSEDGAKPGYVIFVYDRGAWRYHAENWLGK